MIIIMIMEHSSEGDCITVCDDFKVVHTHFNSIRGGRDVVLDTHYRERVKERGGNTIRIE